MEDKSNAKKLRPLKLIPVPRLLDHIGLAMYSKFPKAIGELVVNGYDADATEVNVHVSSDEVLIIDNGGGMDEKQIRENYMLLGSDQKRRVRRTPKFKRLPVGNKGIGKLAGLGIADRMEIRSVKDGKVYKFSIDREELKKKKTLEKAIFDDFTVEEPDWLPCGTVITLTNLCDYVKIDVSDLRGYLAREIPQDQNFRILVNDELCTRKDIPAKRKILINTVLYNCGKIKGEIIIAKKSFTLILPGVVTTVRGRAVGKPNLFGVYKSKHRFYHSLAQLITGSIEVESFDPEEETDERPVIQTDREGFIEDHPKYIAYEEFMTNLLLKTCKEEEDEFNKKNEAEKEAKVKDALKNVINDLNAFNKEKRQEMKGTDKSPVADDSEQSSTNTIFKKTEEDLEDSRDLNTKKRTNPVGITDKKLRKELKALIGSGSIRLGGKRYKVVTKPLGEDDYECRIDDVASLIVINISHPAYDQAVAERAVELTVYRAITNSFANKESEFSEQMYDKIDEMLRFQAGRIKFRREKKKKSKK